LAGIPVTILTYVKFDFFDDFDEMVSDGNVA
jgi:hypothetical protein